MFNSLSHTHSRSHCEWPHGAIGTIVLATCLLATPVSAQDPLATGTEQPEGVLPLKELRIFVDVFNEIRTSYVEEVDDLSLIHI